MKHFSIKDSNGWRARGLVVQDGMGQIPQGLLRFDGMGQLPQELKPFVFGQTTTGMPSNQLRRAAKNWRTARKGDWRDLRSRWER